MSDALERHAADETIRQAVTRILNDHGRAAEALDVPTAAEMFAEGARLMLPGMPTVVGRKQIAALMSQAWEAVRPVEIRFSTEEVYGVGETAVTVGTYHFTLEPEGQDQIQDEGRFMLLWATDGGGRWRVFRDVTNSALPVG